jgi:hypothetical protein
MYPQEKEKVVAYASVSAVETAMPLVPGNVHARFCRNDFRVHRQAGLRQTPHHGLGFLRRNSSNNCCEATAQVKAILELAQYLRKELCKRGDIWRSAPEAFCQRAAVRS